MSAIPFNAIYPDGPGSAAQGGPSGAAAGGGNPQYPGMPVGANPIHKDATFVAAGTFALWSPSAGMRFVLVSAMISTDTAMRIALVDGADIPGSRPVAGAFAANGGVSKNQVPVPYPAKTVGSPLLAVIGALPGALGVMISIDGWEQPG